MVHEVMNIPGLEFVEDWYRHRAVGHCGQEADRPVDLVASADGHLVAFVQKAFLECDVQFLDAPRHIPVAEADSLVVGKGLSVPIVSEALLQKLVD